VRLDVVPTAEAVEATALAGASVLVVDVLRASTTIIAALGNGGLAVIPVADPAEARRRAAALGPAGTLLAGERRGEPIPGFDLGNSPLEMTAARVGGKTIVLTTSNGTRALLAARPAGAIGVAAFVNLSAAVAWLLASERDVTVLCAGERGRVSLEDHVCAGLLVDRLARQVPRATLSARALDAARAATAYGTDVGRLAEASPWARRLCLHGRGGDVGACLGLDTASLVPVYRPDVDKVVAGLR
jgi:2-phosphosulfolactate phosphatase